MENKTEIIEGDKLIAEFRGVTEQPWLYGSTRIRLNVPGVGSWFKDRGLQYHSSWDWLMPAWEKFSKLVFTDSSVTALHLNYCARITIALAAADIHLAHKYLVNGIKWYNQNSTK